jgi:hypothetical protein
MVFETDTVADKEDDRSPIRIEYKHKPVNIQTTANILPGTDFAVVSPYLHCKKML